jgi:hypothetical protein
VLGQVELCGKIGFELPEAPQVEIKKEEAPKKDV